MQEKMCYKSKDHSTHTRTTNLAQQMMMYYSPCFSCSGVVGLSCKADLDLRVEWQQSSEPAEKHCSEA